MVALSQVFTLFLLIVVGYVVKKQKVVTERIHGEVSNLVLNVCLPAMVIHSMNFAFSPDVLVKSGQLVLAAFVIYSGTILLSYPLTRLMGARGQQRDIFQYVLVFSNVGYMGYPVINAVMGERGVFYTAIYNLAFTVLVWTFGVHLMTRGSAEAGDSHWVAQLKRVVNPNLIALAIGFVLFLFSIELPAPVSATIKMIGDTTTPLSMMFIGFILSDVSIRETVSDPSVYGVSAMRLLLLPLLVFAGFRLLGVTGDLLTVAFISTAMPAAANTAILAAVYGNDYHLGSRTIFISTLLSVVTLPLMILLLGV